MEGRKKRACVREESCVDACERREERGLRLVSPSSPSEGRPHSEALGGMRGEQQSSPQSWSYPSYRWRTKVQNHWIAHLGDIEITGLLAHLAPRFYREVVVGAEGGCRSCL